LFLPSPVIVDAGRARARVSLRGRGLDDLTAADDLFSRIVARWDGEPADVRRTGVAHDVALVHIASMSNLFAALGWAIVDLVEHPDERAAVATGDPDVAERCALESTRLDYAWGGNVAFTRDQLPHAGRLDSAYYAGGYCGHGVAMGTYLGGLIARRMAGELLEHPLINDNFPPIPLYRGTPWFLPLVGAYYALKDRLP